MKLSGMSALITGASEGLGSVIAYRFVADGASVALTARTSETLETVRQSLLPMCVPGQTILAIPCDVSNPEEVDRLIATVVSTLSGLDTVINNASVFGPIGSLDEIPWQGWIDTFNTNLHGTVYTCRGAIPHLKRSRRGKIINISGGGAAQALPSLCAYAASKAAVLRFTEELAEELRPFHIDVNAVAPGPLNTRFVDHAISAGPERLGARLYKEIMEIRKNGGTPFSLGANLCAYLASSVGDGITGKLISARYDDWATLREQLSEFDAPDLYTMRRIDPYTIKRNSSAIAPKIEFVPLPNDETVSSAMPVSRRRGSRTVVSRTSQS
jgi:3-oxoacyl-[acyl-carrier protein] reductase